MKQSLPDIDTIKSTFEYNIFSGDVIWVNPPKRSKLRVGQRAGSVGKSGIPFVTFQRRTIQLSHIVFALCNGRWPRETITYRDGDRTNTKLDNLRERSWCDAARERTDYKKRAGKSVSKYRGVSKIGNKFRVHVVIGVFSTAEEAATAYDKAVEQFWGSKFPTNRKLGLLP